MSDEPRITTFRVGDLSIPVDADKSWHRFSNDIPEGQLETVADESFWIIHLPWFNQPEDLRQRFWENFNTAAASKNRSTAILGLKYTNGGHLLELLNAGIQFDRDLKGGHFKGKTDRMKNAAMVIALKFSEVVSKKDPKALRKMADILQEGGITVAREIEGETVNRTVFTAFRDLVKESRLLPTKKQIRHKLGWGDDDDAIDKLREALNALGLSGLPKA